MKTNHNIFRGTFFFLILLRVRDGARKFDHPFSFSDSKKANLKFVDYSHFFVFIQTITTKPIEFSFKGMFNTTIATKGTTL